MENKLTFNGIISESFAIALKNIASIIGAVILWILTIWIPYINVGTTIAIISMPIELSKGKIMSPTAIFDAKYRKYMGEFFILVALMEIGITVAYVFLVIPGIVISIAWSLAIYLLLDKGMEPLDAIKKSNDFTYGYKWTIFFAKIVLAIVPFIVIWIGSAIGGFIGVIIELIGLIFLMPLIIAADSVIYKNLTGGSTQTTTETE
jgi:uncharacterized membrane protein